MKSFSCKNERKWKSKERKAEKGFDVNDVNKKEIKWSDEILNRFSEKRNTFH